MSEKEISLGRLFVQEAIKAGTWGFIFLLIMGMFITSIKQDIKEGIEFSLNRAAEKAIIVIHQKPTPTEKKAIDKDKTGSQKKAN